jgi:phytoene dehydrogenase-like protein
VAVETQDETWEARCVVSATHLHATLSFLGHDAPALMRWRVGRLRIGNGMGIAVRCAVDSLPGYVARPGSGPQHTALQLISPDLSTVRRALSDHRAGRLPSEPIVTAMTFSSIDGSLAPPEKHTLFLWAQYYPYDLADGRSWDDIGDEAADALLAHLGRYAPGVEQSVRARLVQTPTYFERVLGLPRANIVHLDVHFSQMLWFRPGIARNPWRTPVRGLYVTGASTHPGGGVLGTPGLFAAKQVLEDLGRGTIDLA